MTKKKSGVVAPAPASNIIDDIRSFAGYVLDEIREKKTASRTDQRMLLEHCDGDERKVLQLLNWLAYEAGVHVNEIIIEIKRFSNETYRRALQLARQREHILSLHEQDLIPVQGGVLRYAAAAS